MRFRQYIPVKTSEGGGGEEPDPAVFCPAKGYYDPMEPLKYEPDPNLPEIPELGPDEIILICTTALDAAINVITTTSTGQVNYSVYGNNNNLIYSINVNSNTTFFYEFPDSGGTELTSGLQAFTVIIKPVTGSITAFQTLTRTNWAPFGWPILECHVQCPNLTSFVKAFLLQKYIRLIKFYGNADSLTNLSSFAEETENLMECYLPTSLNALLSLSNAFRLSGIEKIHIQASELPNLQTLYRAFSGSKIKSNPLEHISLLPELLNFESTFSSTLNLKIDLILPEAPLCNTILYIANNSAITKLIFQGKMNGTFTSTTIQGIIWNAKNCVEVVMPEEMLNLYDFSYTWRDAMSLKKIVLPKKIAFYNNTSGGIWFKATGTSLMSDYVEEITTCEEWDVPSTYTFNFQTPRKLTLFNQPALKPARVIISGTSTNRTNLVYINIDFSGLDPTYNLDLRYNQLDTDELERISALLPVVDSGTFLCIGNPGYSTFDRTIAEAKGWTIN